MKLLAATNNQHKLHELRTLLAPIGIEVLSAADVGGIPDVIEDADSFAGNAAKKACEVAQALQMPVFSDDSGLCVDALNDRPGIYSARYGGPGLNDRDRCDLLLEEMQPHDNRKARFVCVIAVADAQGQLLGTSEGACHGTINKQALGDEGFGYDPLFIPDGYNQSFAQLGEEIKNSLSHRKHAVEKAISDGIFKKVLNHDPS